MEAKYENYGWKGLKLLTNSVVEKSLWPIFFFICIVKLKFWKKKLSTQGQQNVNVKLLTISIVTNS